MTTKTMTVRSIPLADLTVDPANARLHSDRNVETIADSLGAFGQYKPIVVQASTMRIIAGNGTYAAAEALAWSNIDCHVIDVDDATATAIGIADNRTAELASWDDAVLADLIGGLDPSLQKLTGFDEAEIGEMLGLNGEPPPEDPTPEPPAEPKTEPGRMYQLGRHRVMCGDSTDEAVAKRLLDGDDVGLCLTDPPYGVSIVKNGMVGADFGVAKKGIYQPVEGDEAIPSVAYLKDQAESLIIWGGNYFANQLEPSGSWLIWDKRAGTEIKNTFADCELAWSNCGGPARIHRQLWNGMIRAGEKDKRVHPTQKPVALMAWCMSFADGIVYDPFLGSGTTLIAAEQLGRTCYGMEISPAYCDVIVQRYCNLKEIDPAPVFASGFTEE